MASDIVWTNHLEERLVQRGVSRNEAYEAIRHPDKSIRLSSDKWKFHKNFSHKQVTIVAVNKTGQWIILTAWSKAPHQKNYKHQQSDPLISRIVLRLLKNFVKVIKNIIFNR